MSCVWSHDESQWPSAGNHVLETSVSSEQLMDSSSLLSERALEAFVCNKCSAQSNSSEAGRAKPRSREWKCCLIPLLWSPSFLATPLWVYNAFITIIIITFTTLGPHFRDAHWYFGNWILEHYCISVLLPCFIAKETPSPWPMWLSWLGIIQQSKRLLVWFSIRARACVMAPFPVGHIQEATNQCFSLTLTFFSLSFSYFPLSLKINNIFA